MEPIAARQLWSRVPVMRVEKNLNQGAPVIDFELAVVVGGA